MARIDVPRSAPTPASAPAHASVPTPVLAAQAVAQGFARLNGRAWGIAVGLVAGLGLLVATWTLVLIGGAQVGPHLALLANFFPGYRVTFGGGLLGFVYAFVFGYAFGRLIGAVYNRLLPPAFR